MNVRTLIEKLSKLDQDLTVYAYSKLDECGTGIRDVKESDEFPDCKGDLPDGYEDGIKFVLITGRG